MKLSRFTLLGLTVILTFATLGCSAPKTTSIGNSTPAGSNSQPVANGTIALTSPLDGATVRNAITLQANTGADVQVDYVEFRWDSTSFGPEAKVSQPPYTYQWDTTKFVDGFYTLTALVVEKNGKSRISNLVTVKVVNQTTGGTPMPPTSNIPNPPTPSGKIIRVPGDAATPQAAINIAQTGDLIELAPGTYSGGLTISNKAVILTSRFHNTADPQFIENTIISGGSPVITITGSAAGTVVRGLTIHDGSKGVVAFVLAHVLDNLFLDNGSDAMSFEEAGGVIRGNTFIGPSDEAVDLDYPMATLIENNTMSGCGDDGIEIRNHNYTGPLLEITIRNNVIRDVDEDGIQIIDYSANSNRLFRIERNLITNSAFAGIGIMDNGETKEDFRAASIPERILVFHNTFVNNNHGISGGDNLIALNNIIVGSVLGLKGVDGSSIAANNLFFNNGTNFSSSNVDASTTRTGNPLFTADYRLMSGSPAVDAGTKSFVKDGVKVFELMSGQYRGLAPDLGAFELGN